MTPTDPKAWQGLGWDAEAACELAAIAAAERRAEIREQEHADYLVDRREGRES